jgi:hypothetical protein
MTDVNARFEFRAFAQTFGLVAEKIRRYSECHGIAESVEMYLIGNRDEGDCNVKLRRGRLQIKRLIDRREGLERWKPAAEETSPLSCEFLRGTLFPALGVKEVELAPAPYSFRELLDEFARHQWDVWPANVFKRRFYFEIDHCPTEMDELLINGAAIGSVAVESEETLAVLTVLDKLGLSEYENINYPRAIRRIMGRERWPREVDYDDRD